VLSALVSLLTIEIGIDPEIGKLGGLLLTWHGVLVAVAIAVGVYLAVQIGQRKGFTEDDAYTAALVGVPAGIIGARALFIAENWHLFEDAPLDIFRINEGGISIYGAIIGGVLGAWVYGIWRGLPIGKGLDAAAFGLILGMAIGRIGCLIAGDTLARSSSLPWAVEYTHVNSANFGMPSQHPAVAYEMLGDLLIFGLLFVLSRVYRKDGLVFFSYLGIYSLMRFGLNFLRLDSKTIAGGDLNVMQMVALGVLISCVLGFVYYWRKPAAQAAPTPEAAPTEAPASHS
jgi:phosphatidylglycerol:prolipoprotein diacylglycerol transferase